MNIKVYSSGDTQCKTLFYIVEIPSDVKMDEVDDWVTKNLAFVKSWGFTEETAYTRIKVITDNCEFYVQLPDEDALDFGDAEMCDFWMEYNIPTCEEWEYDE